MTTVDTLVGFAERVEQHAQRERKPIEWRKVLLAIVAGVPYVMGRLVGRTVYLCRFMASAAAEGYRAGDRPTPARTGRAPRVAVASVDG